MRLKSVIADGQQKHVAMRSGISTSTLSRIIQGAVPGLDQALMLAHVTGTDLMWLATGKGLPSAGSSGHVAVPIYDVRLAAGVASFSDAAEQIGEMPFDRGMLRDLGRSSADGLAVFIAEGDSMEPTIQDGARVLADLKDTRLREGIFAFRTGDELRIKRLRRLVDGIEINSDNERYSPELVTGDAADELTIIGNILWTGTAL